MPFERLGAERTPVEGTGLGLALSRTIVEGMGGTIGIEHRAPGECAVFFVELSLAHAQTLGCAQTPGRA